MHPRLKISLSQCSNTGMKDRNEDFYGAYIPRGTTLDNKGIACAIADGVASCTNAQKASEHCVRSFLNDYFSTPDTWSVKSSGTKVLTAINKWLLSYGNKDRASGMVTTFSAIIFKSTTAHIFHVGNSRIYRLRRNNNSVDLELITTDHRVWISGEKNYLSRAMGIDSHLDIDYITLTIEEGDEFLMTTDGIHDYLNDQQLKQHLTADSSIEVKADKIVMHALESKSNDNLTCQIIKIENLPFQDVNEFYDELTRLPFPPLLSPGMTLDGYEILGLAHTNTASRLYKVRDIKSKKIYLMKTPSPHYSGDPAYIDRFHIEEWAGRRIRSNLVLKVIERSRQRNFLYFILEYIDGISLKQWAKQHPSPDIEQVIEITDKVIKATRVFHRLEMLHLNLNPDNIMITAHGLVKIIDFSSINVAGLQEMDMPAEKLDILGTKNFTAPEYQLGIEGNRRSDIYSLGVLVYYLLTGQLPYGEMMSRNLNWRSLNKLRYRPSIRYNPMIPLWMDKAIHKAVKIEPRSRYTRLSEFFFDLTHPEPTPMLQNTPLLEKNPVLFWQYSFVILLIANLILLLYFFA